VDIATGLGAEHGISSYEPAVLLDRSGKSFLLNCLAADGDAITSAPASRFAVGEVRRLHNPYLSL
jgi:hypothetical protein